MTTILYFSLGSDCSSAPDNGFYELFVVGVVDNHHFIECRPNMIQIE